MNSELYKDHLSKLNNKLINDFDPKISNDFEKDKIIYSDFWKNCTKENSNKKK